MFYWYCVLILSKNLKFLLIFTTANHISLLNEHNTIISMCSTHKSYFQHKAFATSRPSLIPNQSIPLPMILLLPLLRALQHTSLPEGDFPRQTASCALDCYTPACAAWCPMCTSPPFPPLSAPFLYYPPTTSFSSALHHLPFVYTLLHVLLYDPCKKSISMSDVLNNLVTPNTHILLVFILLHKHRYSKTTLPWLKSSLGYLATK